MYPVRHENLAGNVLRSSVLVAESATKPYLHHRSGRHLRIPLLATDNTTCLGPVGLGCDSLPGLPPIKTKIVDNQPPPLPAIPPNLRRNSPTPQPSSCGSTTHVQRTNTVLFPPAHRTAMLSATSPISHHPGRLVMTTHLHHPARKPVRQIIAHPYPCVLPLPPSLQRWALTLRRPPKSACSRTRTS